MASTRTRRPQAQVATKARAALTSVPSSSPTRAREAPTHPGTRLMRMRRTVWWGKPGALPPVPMWVMRPTFSVGYSMPMPRRRGGSAWGYTLPGEVRGAFIRALGGVILRQGRARECAMALNKFCAGPQPAPLVEAHPPLGGPAPQTTPGVRVRRRHPRPLAHSGELNLGARLAPPRPAPAPVTRLRVPAHLNM